MVAPLTVLRLRSADTGVIAKQLIPKVAQMPQFFQDAPVLIDLGGLGEEAARLHFGELAALLRSCKMVPVAITGGTPETRTKAATAGFGYVTPPAQRGGGRALEVDSEVMEATPPPEPVRAATASTPAAAPAPTQATAAARPARVLSRQPMVIRQPVRSGQTVYAQGTDLVLLAPVSSGAEVIADGNVHCYSTLRGRAVAGRRGMTDARIFCQRLDAEIVAIAGAYLLSEDLPAEHKNKPVQIYLEDGICMVTPL